MFFGICMNVERRWRNISYSVSFRVKVEGVDTYISVGDCSANITWNVRDIICQSTGLPWLNEENNGLCLDVIPSIQQGLTTLCLHGDQFRHLESPNGWGTVKGVKHFFHQILLDWSSFCISYPELVPIAVFWID